MRPDDRGNESFFFKRWCLLEASARVTVLGVTVLRATASVDTFMQVIAKYVAI